MFTSLMNCYLFHIFSKEHLTNFACISLESNFFFGANYAILWQMVQKLSYAKLSVFFLYHIVHI